MMEITIQGQVYQFNFGMGFIRDINSKVSTTVNGMQGVKKNIGLSYYVASIIDGDIESLIDMLDIANRGMNPRLTKHLLDAYVDDPETDIDGLFESVIDFLSRNNATRKTVRPIVEAAEAEKNKQ